MSLFSRLFRRRLRPPGTEPSPPPAALPRAEPIEPVAPPDALDIADLAPPPPPHVERIETPLEHAAAPEADTFVEPEPEDEEPDAEANDAIGPDPFIGAGEPLQISLPTEDGLAAARRDAEALALSGPQRVTLADPAGPGSLAETLARLETEGRLTSEVVDDPEEGPFILYRPAGAG